MARNQAFHGGTGGGFVGVGGLGGGGVVREKENRYPKGPKIENSKSPSETEIFKRDCKFQASHPPNPYFCVCVCVCGGGGEFSSLVAPCRAILRYYRCDTPY